MRHVVLLRAAREDLDDIWSYIAERDDVAADLMVDRVRQATRLLADRPSAGADASDLRPGLRKWSVSPYIVFYMIGEEQIDIVRIVHGARDRRRIVVS